MGGHIKQQTYQSFEEISIYKILEDFIIRNVPDNISDVDKVTYITNILANYIQYNDKQLEFKKLSRVSRFEGTASNASLFVSGYAICQDYALFVKSIFDRIGIRCDYKDGTPEKKAGDETNPAGHAFNLVYIDNKPYWIDVTWISGKLRWNYRLEDVPDFLCGDDSFYESHSEYMNQKEGNAQFTGNKEDYPQEKKIESIGRLRKIQEEYKNGQRKIIVPDGLPKDSPVVQEMIKAMQGEIIRRDGDGAALAKWGREDVLKDMRSRLGLLREFSREYEKETQEGGYVHGS